MRHILLSQKGSLAVQFLFGWVLAMGFVAVFAALTLTLSIAEVVQYITYASSHSLMLGQSNPNKQEESAVYKYSMLTKTSEFCTFFKHCNPNGMFSINPDPQLGINPVFNPQANYPYLFMGVWTSFKADILDINIPFFGSTSEGAGSNNLFSSSIGSYLGKEPTVEECQSFDEKRLGWIYQRNQRYQNVSPDEVKDKDFIFDNGC